MRPVSELPVTDLRAGGDAVETLVELAEYLPPRDPLISLAGQFRDQIRTTLGMPRKEPARRGSGRKDLNDLLGADLRSLSVAVHLLTRQFTPYMDDELVPKLFLLNAVLEVIAACRARDAEQARAS